MTSPPARISVVVPTYNRAAALRECLDSILAQSAPAHEILVIDDGSTDETPEVLADYGDAVVPIAQANAGVSAARNAGIRRATGDWIAFLDSDDVWLPDRLAVAQRDLPGLPERVGVHVAALSYTGDGYAHELFALRGVSFPDDRADIVEDPLGLAIRMVAYCQTAVVRRDRCLRVGGFDEAMRMNSDVRFFAELALLGPWALTGRQVAEVRRLPSDPVAIGTVQTGKTLEHARLKVRYLDALLERPASPAQRTVLQRSRSGALLQLASAQQAAGDAGDPRRTLVQAARAHPSPLKGWLKSALPLALGSRGYRIALRQGTGDFRREASGGAGAAA